MTNLSGSHNRKPIIISSKKKFMSLLTFELSLLKFSFVFYKKNLINN